MQASPLCWPRGAANYLIRREKRAEPPISWLVLIRLFQQTTTSSVGVWPARRFQGVCVSFSWSSPPKRPANSTWLPVVGLMGSCVLAADIGAPTR